MWRGKDISLTTLSLGARTFIKLGPLLGVKFRVLPRVSPLYSNATERCGYLKLL